jgi:hypothetical protein
MMNKIVLILCLVFLLACKEQVYSPSTRDTGIAIAYKNSNNQDLLDPATPNSLKEEDIDLFYLPNNGQKTRIYNPGYDIPKGFRITKASSGYLISLGFEPYSDGYNAQNKATFFIRYSDGSEDTLIGEYNADRRYIIKLLKVWVNGVLKYDVESSNTQSGRLITIIK